MTGVRDVTANACTAARTDEPAVFVQVARVPLSPDAPRLPKQAITLPAGSPVVPAEAGIDRAFPEADP